MIWQETPEGLLIQVKTQPKAAKPGWGRVAEGRIQLKVSAPAVDGKANEACIEFLAKEFRCPKSGITLLRGETSRQKTFLLTHPDPARLKAWITSYCSD